MRLILITVIIAILILAVCAKKNAGEKPTIFSKKYREIAILELMLKKEKIEHYAKKAFDGWQIIVPLKVGELSVIEHAHSYGSVMDLLEIMDDYGNVKGFQNAAQTLEIIKEKNKKK